MSVTRELTAAKPAVARRFAWVASLFVALLIQPLTTQAQTPAAPTATTAPTTTPTPAATAVTTPAPTAEPAIAAPAPNVTGPAPATSPAAALTLPRDLSPWGMFMAADIVVKAVMIGLAFASVLTWTIWLAKLLELMRASARLHRGIAAIAAARTWDAAKTGADANAGGVAPLLREADNELQLSLETAGPHAISPDGVKERIASRLERAEAAAGRAMMRGTSILATIGATAPFVGLFGTVWGIMNAFIGISKAHTTNLAVVAPGIAEALLATALGLIAAIPAVVMYNFFSRWIAGYRALNADATASIMRLVSRELERGAFDRRRHAGVAAE
ncbi:MAG: tonB-system energizer ExbB [Proteobacteria bacterium]|nr:tonB-system energizer ExbB [Pseudomonadota bacterium]